MRQARLALHQSGLLSTVDTAIANVSEADSLEINEVEKLARWKARRAKKLTASICPNLMKGGRDKNVAWGETSKSELLAVYHERVTGKERISLDLPQFRWGHENEPLAFAYYKQHYNPRARYSMDFDDILFFEPFPGFGVSPDSVTYDDNSILEGISEIKCPENGVNHLKYCLITGFSKGDDYYYQLIGQFLTGCKWIDFVSFDPRFPDGHAQKMHVVRLLRENYLFDIVALENRLKIADMAINKAIEEGLDVISNIDSYNFNILPNG